MRIVVLTVAFCPAAQLAHMFLKFREKPPWFEHYVINGHYPLESTEKLRLITTAARAKWIDPGEDLGSAQTQNWAIRELKLEDDDFFINLDPDSSCIVPGWMDAMFKAISADERLAIVHLYAFSLKHEVLQRQLMYRDSFLQPIVGEPIKIRTFPKNLMFNISLWRMSAVNAMGGIPQAFPFYGQVETPTQIALRRLKLYDAYLPDYTEEMVGKFLSDEVFMKWKYCHTQIQVFNGKFKDFLEWIKTPYGKEIYDKVQL